MKILIVGNCQFRTISDVFKRCFPNSTIDSYRIDDSRLDSVEIDSYDYLISHKFAENYGRFSETSLKKKENTLFIPYVTYSGYHPDCIYHVKSNDGTLINSPINKNAYHSLIISCAFAVGISKSKTFELFNSDFYELLSYATYEASADEALRSELNKCGLDGEFLLDKWKLEDTFMYTVNHCKHFVLIDIAIRLAMKIDNDLCLTANAHRYLYEDYLALDAEFFDINTNMLDAKFKRSKQFRQEGASAYLDLPHFIDESYEIYGEHKSIIVDSKYLDRFKVALTKYEHLNVATIKNPYTQSANRQFWKRAIFKDISKVDITINPKFKIDKHTKVATAGSCFAQHIARSLDDSGYAYYVAEQPPKELSEKTARDYSYGLFSSRYGNIYTVRQLVQLIERAFGIFKPKDELKSWKTANGLVDPFRPNIGEVFENEEQLLKSKYEHLAAVREQFCNLDVFVFTLGLTEAWISKLDGTVYPLCPYVVTKMNNNDYMFKNFSYEEVLADLVKFLDYLSILNSNAKLLLTVSPVPLIATFEDRHVLTSTTESKCILRSAASKVSSNFSNVEYFPSYEIITGSYNESSFFMDNLREVKPEGVTKVMQSFFKSFDNDSILVNNEKNDVKDSEFITDELSKLNDIVCDEELLDP